MSNNEFCAVVAGQLVVRGPLGFLLAPLLDPFVPDTKTKYHPNVVIGWNDGTVSGGGTWTKSGGCNDLLQIKHLKEG